MATDRDQLEPYYSGVRIVNEIHRMYPSKFEWKIGHFDRLCGTPKVRRAISRGTSLEKLREEWQVELQTFQRIRDKYLIYPE